MPTLTLLRHAKAALAAPGLRDIDRPLTERGRRDAARIGTVLAERAYDLALVSAASRTAETWEMVRDAFESPPPVDLDRDLYLGGARALIARLRTLPPTAASVLVVGHNPDMQEVALWLAGGDESGKAREMRHKYPTCAAAIFDVSASAWNEIGPKTVRLTQFLAPADFGLPNSD